MGGFQRGENERGAKSEGRGGSGRRGCSPPARGVRGLCSPGRRGPRRRGAVVRVDRPAGSRRDTSERGERDCRARWPCAGFAARPQQCALGAQRGPEPAARRAEWGGVPRRIAGSVGAWLAAGAIVGGGRGPPRPVEPSACSAPPPWGCGAFWRVRGAGRVGGGAAGGTQGRRQAGGRKMFSRPPRIEKGRARIDFRG